LPSKIHLKGTSAFGSSPDPLAPRRSILIATKRTLLKDTFARVIGVPLDYDKPNMLGCPFGVLFHL
jgi:hypothetical protein